MPPPNSEDLPKQQCARVLVWCLRNTMHSAARSFGQERGAPTAHIRNGSVRETQRSAWPKERPPRGLRRKWPADFVTRRLQPHEGDAPSTCLVIGPFWAQQKASYFANTTLASSTQPYDELAFQNIHGNFPWFSTQLPNLVGVPESAIVLLLLSVSLACLGLNRVRTGR